VQKFCLSYPNIWFEFSSDEKLVFKYNSWEDLKTRIYNIYWEEFHDNLLEINFNIPWLKISGYISDPKISFKNKNRQNLFVNKRSIKSPLIFKAINDGYNRFIPHGTFPSYILNLEIDPTQIDVNVHPRKLEIKFAQESEVFRAFYHWVKDKLDKVSLISINNNWNESFIKENEIKKEEFYTGSGTKFKSYSPYKNTENSPNQKNIYDTIEFSSNIISGKNNSFIKEENFNNYSSKDYNENNLSNDLHDTSIWRIIWQAHNSYIIVETKEWLKVLDQHALAERVIYEKLVLGQYKSKTQGLLIAESFNLTAKEIEILNENNNTFEEMWFDFEIISWNSVILSWIPDFIKKENIRMIFEAILEDLWEHKFTSSKSLDEVRNKIFAYTACRSAIKFWNKLNLFEMNKLLNDSCLDYSSTCPHWRPVVYEISLDEIKNKYER
jgi:DNA mismatch repair protein MutL